MEHLEDVADVILEGDVTKLDELAESKTASVLKVWIAKAAKTGIERGDIFPLDSILNRVLGKPKERVEHTGKDGEAIEVKSSLKMGIVERIAMIKGEK